MTRELDSSSDYPEILLELQTFLESNLEDIGFGVDVSLLSSAVTELIRAYWGGAQIYIPRGRYVDVTVRNIKVEASFTGRKTDTRAICKRYDLTERHVYRIVNEVREARRKRLAKEATYEIKTGGANEEERSEKAT